MGKIYNEFKKRSNNYLKVGMLFFLGLVLLIITLIMSDGIINTVLGTLASYFIVSSVLDFLNKCWGDEELINKVCDCINGESKALKLGITDIRDEYSANLTDDLFNIKDNNIFILHVYGYAWTEANRKEIIEFLKNEKNTLNIVLADYREEKVSNIYTNQYSQKDAKRKIVESLKLWREIYESAGEKNNLNIRLYKGIINNAIYGNGKCCMCYHFSSSIKRNHESMTYVKAKKIEDGIYMRYKDEFDDVFEQSDKIDIKSIV